jgi:hypothetical protein
MAARIDEAANTYFVADLELCYLTSRARNYTGNLVAWNHGEDGAAPLFAGLVDVGVAYATVQNVDQHLVRARRSAANRNRAQSRFRGRGRISSGWEVVIRIDLCIL